MLAEGVKGIEGGYAIVHTLPIFQEKIAMGDKGFPGSYSESRSDIDYSKGICPVAERYHDKLFLNLELAELSLDLREVAMIVEAFRKVWLHHHHNRHKKNIKKNYRRLFEAV